MTDLTEEVARALFDGRPHNNWVKGIQQIPNWDLQPDHLKAVFRRDAQAAIAIVLERAADSIATCHTVEQCMVTLRLAAFNRSREG